MKTGPEKKYIQVVTTTVSMRAAEKIAAALLGKRLAACVQTIGPVVSRYRWKGKLESAREFICIIKTSGKLYRLVEKEILANHPYETPEILALPVIEGSRAYLKWLANSLTKVCHPRG